MSDPCICSGVHSNPECPRHGRLWKQHLVSRRPAIALCVMVKNEAKTLPRLIESVRGFADHIIALDTGSTDDTIAVLKAAGADVRASTFVDFGKSRTELMQFAKGKADWLLLMDADQFLRFHADNINLDSIEADAFQLCHAGTNRYYVTRLVKGDLDWRFVGVTHEYIECTSRTPRVAKLDGVKIEHYADGGSRGDKFSRDLRLLTKECYEQPLNSRARFYLANTLRDCGRLVEARKNYLLRVEMGGWDEEVFVARLEAAKISRDPLELLQTWFSRPTRAEPLAILEQVYLDYNDAEKANAVAAVRAKIALPNDILFVDTTAYGDQVTRTPGWKTIPGWCDFEGFYRKMAAMLPVPDRDMNPLGFFTFVEVGTYLGQSFACFDYYANKVGKRNGLMIAVDTFRGTQSEPMEKKSADAFPNGYRQEFAYNMKRLGVRDPHIIALPSVEAAKSIARDSVDFVFIDGEHTFEAVSADIAAWLPTVHSKGYIGGHDYDRPEVAMAVSRYFAAADVFIEGRCWVARKSAVRF